MVGKVTWLAFQAVFVIVLQYFVGFYGVSAYAILLVVIAFVFLGKPHLHLSEKLPFWSKLVSRGFLFISYIVVCVLVPRAHPFAKYAMFNKFPEVVYVHILRDENNELVPIEKYSHLKNDDLYAYSVFISEKHGFAHGNNLEKRKEEEQMCYALIQLFLDNLKPGHPKFEMLTLYKITFTLQNQHPVKNEIPLCAYVGE